MPEDTAILKEAAPITTNVLIIGGSFAGIGVVVALRDTLKAANPPSKITATVVEPRAGFLNLLGVPRAIVDPEFAKTQYVPLEEYKTLRFDRLISDDEYVLKSASGTIELGVNPSLEITYVQGKVTNLDKNSAEYVLNNNSGGSNKISFDYCVVAAGRNRKWPTSPDGLNFESYMKEMIDFNADVQKSNKIAVIGAGAVGIEIAGDVKSHYPDKEVLLIHPHPTFPPEKLKDEFKQAVRESLEKADVKLILNKRVKRELDNKNLELTTGEIIEADFTYWCTSFKNNTDLLQNGLEKFVTPTNNVWVNEYFQLSHPDTKDIVENIFCVGDMVEIAVIKTAGYAIAMGQLVGANLASKILQGKFATPFPPERYDSMLLVCGNNDVISDVMGKVEINNEEYVEMYKDYRFDTVKTTLGV